MLKVKSLKHKSIKIQEHKNLIIWVFGFCIALLLYCSITLLLFPNRTLAADFNANDLISDGSFVAINDMSAGDIQNFLNNRGGMLKDYSENGRSAAQIIYDASHGHEHASGECNGGTVCNGVDINSSTGTVNPKVLLVTLQKEQSLITRTDYSQYALDWAMGYGCPDNGDHQQLFQGFTKQVENAAWQLRYNYELAKQGRNSGKNVGTILWIDNTYPNPYGGPPGQEVHIDNGATASLYTYTPHVYNGNYNFWRLYNEWFEQKAYDSEWVSQNVYPSLYPGEAYQFEVTYRNTGTETWQKGTVFLGTDRSHDRIPWMLREGDGPSGWYSGNRVWMIEDSVAPGSTGTFRFWLRIPTWTAAGTYREYFTPVADGHGWMRDQGVYWDINVKSEGTKYASQWVSQNVYPSLAPGQSYNFSVTLKNTGTATWRKGTVNLGTSGPLDHIPAFIRADITDPYGHASNWLSANRIYMQQDSVAPGENATFSFWMSVPNSMPEGTYREYFRLVADGISWLEDYGIYWDINVQHPHAQWVGQSNYPVLRAGEKTIVWVEYKNTGQVAWTKGAINLGTDQPRDRESSFYYSDWLSKNRISLDQSTVNPGETGRFTFFINAPQNISKGTYREYFRPVCEGITWMEDYGVFFDVTVY